MKRLSLVTAVLALAVALTAPAQAGSPVGDTECKFKLRERHPLEKVLKRGLKIKVTCDGPASVGWRTASGWG